MTTRPIILTAAPVAFSSDGSVDLAGSRRILEHIASSGTDGAFVLGTTGEFAALSEEERGELTKLSIETLAGKRLVVHVGAASAFEAKRLIRQAKDAGATAVAALTPYYLPASDAAILSFYREISAAADGLEMYAYLFAARTGNPVSPELFAEIARLPGIVGAKISGEGLQTLEQYRSVAPEGFRLYAGADRELANVIDHGAQGVVSGVASVFPKPFVAMADAIERGDTGRLASLQADIDAVVDLVDGDPERMRAGLAEQGIDAGTSRMALDQVGEEVRARLKLAVTQYA
jgi:dihydrodipicolinate synthase/N-acetylneuraminate lyase